MSEFQYDSAKFTRNLIFRSTAIILLYCAFIVWNFFKVPDENRFDFVKIFGLLSVLLGFYFIEIFPDN